MLHSALSKWNCFFLSNLDVITAYFMDQSNLVLIYTNDAFGGTFINDRNSSVFL